MLICVNQCLNIIRVNSWNLLLKNFSLNSDFGELSRVVSSVAINKSVKSAKSAAKINAFYAKRTQTSLFPAQKQRFGEKTNPKQTQTKPNHWITKMNLYPVLTKRYEKIRLFERNENKPKQSQKLALFNCNLFLFWSVLAFELLEDLLVQLNQSLKLFVYSFRAGDDLSINEEKNDCRHAA